VDDGGDLQMVMHEDPAGLSSHGVHRVVPASSRDLHFDRPQAVIDAILEVVAAARDKR
jgi:hypothetical protein